MAESAALDAGAHDASAAAEAELVRRAQAGEARAFEVLYRSHVRRIYGLCWRMFQGDRGRAEQAAQDAFVRAWEKLNSFRGDSRFGTWLHRLTVNLVLGEQRQLQRWLGSDEGMEATHGTEDDDAGLRMDLEAALACLPPGARSVLWLHDVEGYRHEEIAALTGIAVGTSKAQLHRARRLMRRYLQ